MALAKHSKRWSQTGIPLIHFNINILEMGSNNFIYWFFRLSTVEQANKKG